MAAGQRAGEDVVVRRSLAGGEIPAESREGLEPGAGVSVIVCTYRRAPSMRRFLDSLRNQERLPRRLVVVDASDDENTERMLASSPDASGWGTETWYFRVQGALRGLTRQRNFGLTWIETDLVAFFDDDIVLSPGCLGAMEDVYRREGNSVAGVAAVMDGAGSPPDLLWRTRRALGVVASLRPGTYQRSGMSIPWSFLQSPPDVTDGDYLPGGATMWRTAVIRDLGFNEGFAGYGQGEDLEMSLRARRRGRLVLAGKAHLRHLHEEGGRPDDFTLGYMAIHNRFLIQRRGLDDRSWRDVALFGYAWGVDTLLLLRHLLFPSRCLGVVRQAGGRLRAAIDLVRGK